MKSVLILVLLACLVVPAQAMYYEITGGYGPGLTLQNSDSLLMTGSGLGDLNMYSDSSAIVQNTSTLNQGSGGLWEAQLFDSSSLEFSGGQLGHLSLFTNATATLSGGRIDNIGSYQIAWGWDYGVDPAEWVPNPHITIIYSGELPTLDANNYLTGLWGNGNPFSIYLSDAPEGYGYSPAIENIQFQLIPEPATLLLLSLGGLLLLRK